MTPPGAGDGWLAHEFSVAPRTGPVGERRKKKQGRVQVIRRICKRTGAATKMV